MAEDIAQWLNGFGLGKYAQTARAGYELLVSYDAVIKSDVSSTGQHRRQAKIIGQSGRPVSVFLSRRRKSRCRYGLFRVLDGAYG